MSENTDFVALDDVQALVGDGGYEVSQETEGVLRIRDLDSGIVIRSAIVKNDVAVDTRQIVARIQIQLGIRVQHAENPVSSCSA